CWPTCPANRKEVAVDTSTSKLELAYEELRAAILARRYEAGDHLVESEVASQLGISRPTVRGVFVRLAQDEFVVREPYRGVRVRRCTPAEAVNAYEAREVLEGFAAFVAAEHATAQDIEVLADSVEHMEAAHLREDAAAVLDESRRFHDTVLRAANRPVIASFLRSIQYPMAMFAFTRSSNTASRARTIAEHAAILACLRAHDRAGAEEVMRNHTAARDARAWYGLDAPAAWACSAGNEQPLSGNEDDSAFKHGCEQLRTFILDGYYARGQRLTELQLTRQLNVSRPTLLAVLLRVEQENFLLRRPHRRAQVRSFTPLDVQQLWQARAIVEAGCAGLAAVRASDGELMQLQGLVESMAVTHQAADRAGYAALSRLFHGAILGAAKQPVFAKFLRSISYPSLVVQHRNGGDPIVRAASLAEHQAILACIRIKDPAGAEEVMRKHMLSADPGLPPAN
ncbi:MAG: GntR family transcriptional regulator, partial [Chloroflexota bacterium]